MGTRHANRNPVSSLQFLAPVRFLIPPSFASLCTPVVLLHCKELPLNPCTLIISRYRAPEPLSQSLPYAFFQVKHPTLTETSLRALYSTYQVRESDGWVGARSCNHYGLPISTLTSGPIWKGKRSVQKGNWNWVWELVPETRRMVVHHWDWPPQDTRAQLCGREFRPWLISFFSYISTNSSERWPIGREVPKPTCLFSVRNKRPFRASAWEESCCK